MMIKLNTIVLKVASRCNINCAYCYEYNRGDSSWMAQPKRFGIDSAVTLAGRINEYALSNNLTQFNISLHGGEPALVGAKHLDQIMSELKARCRIPLRFGMQTNGTLVSDGLVVLLKKFDVRVAVSIDGTEYANRKRVDHAGKPTWTRALEGIGILRHAGLFSGIQTVIDVNERPEEILATLAQFEPPEIELGQPFGNFDNPPEGFPDTTSLGDWLLRAFLYWVSSKNLASVKVIILSDALRAVLSDEPVSDWFPSRPPGYLVVATDGSIEGLDTLKVAREEGRVLNLNIRDNTLEQALQHSHIQMRARQTVARPDACQQCAILEWCNGGYYPTRYGRGNGFNNRSIYCTDWITLFAGVARWAIEQKGVSAERKQKIADRLVRLKQEEEFV